MKNIIYTMLLFFLAGINTPVHCQKKSHDQDLPSRPERPAKWDLSLRPAPPDIPIVQGTASANGSTDIHIQFFDSIVKWWSTDNAPLQYSSKDMDYQYINNLNTRFTTYYWDSQVSQWVQNNHTGYVYDDKNRIIEAALYMGTDTLSKTIYKYDDNDNQIYCAIWQDRGLPTLTLIYQIDQVFDADNLLLQNTTYRDYGSPVWMRYSYTYYEDKKMKSETIEEGNGTEYTAIWRDDYTYNLAENTSTIIRSYITGGPASRTIDTYNTSGNRVHTLYQNYVNGTFINSSQSILEYDSNQALTNHLYQKWENFSWQNYYGLSFMYDDRGNNIKLVYENWENNHWVISDVESYSFDENNFLTASSYRYYSEYYVSFDSTHYFFQTVLSKPEQQLPILKVYPNPVSSVFTINASAIQEAKIYNISGNLVGILPKSERVYNIADLPSGLYVLKVKTMDGNVMHQKIIKL